MDIGSGGRKGRKRKGKRDTRDLEQNMFWKRLGDRTSLTSGIYILIKFRNSVVAVEVEEKESMCT